MFEAEMPPSLLPQWQWLILYLILIIVIAWLLISNASASSAEQSMLPHGIPEHEAELESSAPAHGPASDRPITEMKTASFTPVAAAPNLTHQPIPSASSAPVPSPEVPGTASDDLKVIEGIGPKIAGVLQAAGISTFTQLAAADPSRLEEILHEAGLRLADPATWPEQARLAADGNWKAFEELTARLKGGRSV
jgi:predicted flap endonuclease-1-like 5' DNA nuclease